MINNYTFLIVAMGSIALGILTGVTGTFAVLRKQSLLGDSIAHSALAGIAIAYIITATKNTEVLLLGALIIGLIAAYFISNIAKNSRINYESAMALVMSSFFGLGFVLLSHIQKSPDSEQAGLDRFLFGQAATILSREVYLVVAVCLVIILLMTLIWKEIKLYTFDPIYAHSIGLNTKFLDLCLSSFVVAGIIMGIQMVGVVLMSALIIAPAVAARQWTHSLLGMTVLAAIIGAISGFTGTYISASISQFPTGPAIVLIASLFVLISITFAPGRGIISKVNRSHQAKQNFEADMALISLVTHHLDENQELFTKEEFQSACIIDHHREGKAFEKMFSNLLNRNMLEHKDNNYALSLRAIEEYREMGGYKL